MANYKKMVDGKEVELTDDEQAQRLAEEKAWADAAPKRAFEGLRAERDGKLAETDFYALSDVTMSDEMKKYRQDLRDLPSKYDDSTVVKTITWPTKP
tara:strand:+ start:1641 stop:1931 length:291 start_codon:yes stop_codon:yes gene_type:complete